MAAKQNARPLSEQVGQLGVPGPLNPVWEETLMGLPVGWTDYTCTAPVPAPAWPMGRGPDQHPWEPPRTIPPRSCPDRTQRVAALGDAVCVAQAEVAASFLLSKLFVDM